MNTDNLKVGVAAVIGVVVPSADWISATEPVLRLLLLVVQVGVAILSGIYIYRKIKPKGSK